MTLKEEIDNKSKEISTESYSMSLGEIISIYNDGDLNIHPEFQRFFRWSQFQKTRLIESFLLNIPVPPIFISQSDDGSWDVVDGLQRLSTILQFAGVYKDADDKIMEPLALLGTEMLPGLEGLYYDNEDKSKSFDIQLKRYFKRAKLDLIIIKKESDPTNKYEVFQRLNTGGSQLSDQEVRNCLMVAENPDLFKIIQNLNDYENFRNTLRLNERSIEEQYDMELVTRFICLRNTELEDIRSVNDFGNFLDKSIISLFQKSDFDWDKEIDVFKKSFDYIYENLGDDAFVKYDVGKRKFGGGFNSPIFEILTIELAKREGVIDLGFDLRTSLVNLWINLDATGLPWKGNSAAGRLVKTIPLSKKFYNNEI